MQSGSKTLYSLTGSGVRRKGLSPPILAALWETFCIPRMLYGVEILNLQEGEKSCLDRYQNQVFKNLLGIPKTASSAAVSLLTGLPPISTAVDLLHLRLLGKLVSLPQARLERRLFHHTLCHHLHSPTITRLMAILNKYNLPDVRDCLQDKATYHAWKRKITMTTTLTVSMNTCKEVEERSSLHIFHGVNPSLLHDIFPTVIDPPYLREAVVIKAQLLTDTYPTRARLVKITKNSFDPQCPACETALETVEHLIGECDRYQNERKQVLSLFPRSATTPLERLPPATKSMLITRLILLGVTGPVQEKVVMHDFHRITLQYLYDIHKTRPPYSRT